VTLPDLHLSEDALAAYVDRTLSATADDRAARHLRSCAECRSAVDVEREAKALLGAAPDPRLPAGLMARLLDVPMTADLGGTDQVLAIDGDRLGWSTGSTNSDARVVERRAAAPARPRPQVRPAGAARPAGRSARARRTRRGLAVSLAGLAFGVIASAASAGAGAAATARVGDVPGPSSTRLVVGSTAPMDVTRAFQVRGPGAGGGVLTAGTVSLRGR
jgi:putative zinc finger protein